MRFNNDLAWHLFIGSMICFSLTSAFAALLCGAILFLLHHLDLED